MVTAYDARMLVEQGYDRRKSRGLRFNTYDKETMEGQEFLNFLDMTLRCEIAAEIREAGEESGLTVEGVISSLGCIQVREYHGASCISEIDKRQREMYGTMNNPVSREATRSELIFDVFRRSLPCPAGQGINHYLHA